MNHTIQHLNAEVTRGCNLACDYCFNASGRRLPDELSLGEWEKIISESKKNGCKTALFTGGEVMTRPDAPEIIRYAIQQGLQASILTNGHHIQALPKDVLHHLQRVQISLDSANPDTHDARRGKGSWNVARKAIDYVRGLGVPVEISTTISADRVAELKGLAQIASETGSKLLVRPLQSMGRAKDNAKNQVDLKVIQQVKEELRKHYGDILVDDFANYVPISGEDHDSFWQQKGYVTILPNGIIRGTNQTIQAFAG